MKHLFVPCELAVKLKEKGFNEPCFANYFNLKFKEKDSDWRLLKHDGYLTERLGIGIDAPLYQQVTDWFREEHGIELWVSANLGYTRTTYTWHRTGDLISTTTRNNFYIHNEALLSSIEEALKLI